jgi:Na+-transporting methylmalonyl-CoA/oxaloacetate decarboxylase gamma subunit
VIEDIEGIGWIVMVLFAVVVTVRIIGQFAWGW